MSDLSSPETAARVLEHLVEHPTASVRSIGEVLGIGRNTAHNAIRRLLRDEAITVERMGTGHRYPTRYVVKELSR